MTKIQLDYQRALEERRHNVEAEKELEAKANEHRAKTAQTEWQTHFSKLSVIPQFMQALANFQNTKVGTWKNMVSIASALGGGD